MTKLYMYEIGPDHLAAHSEDDAWALWCEHHGERREDYPDESADLVPDDRMFAVLVETKSGAISDSGVTLKLSARDWVTREGRGFLFSSEY
jgi:hypothetical protein